MTGSSYLRGLLFSLLLLLFGGMTLFGQIDIERVMTIGRNAIVFKDFVVAIEHFNQVIQVKPEQAEPYYWRAFSKLMLGDYAGAEADASLCIERNPFLSRAYMVRGGARHNLQQYSKAAADYAKALEITPDDFYLAFNLAGAYYGAGAYREADRSVSSLVKKHPKESRAYFLQAEIKLRLEDTVATEQSIAQGLALDSMQAAPYRILSTIHYLRGDYAAAIQAHDKAILYDPDSSGDYINRGLARYKTKDYQGAMDDYNYAMLLSPHDAVARHNRALLRIEVGDLQGACEDLLEVVQQQPTNLTAHFNLSLIQVQTGHYREAIKTLDYILGRRPEFISGYYQRSEAKRLVGDNAGADRDYWFAYKLEHGQVKPPRPTIADSTGSAIATEELYALEHHDQLRSIETTTSDELSAAGQSSSNLRGAIQEEESSNAPCSGYELTYFSRSSHDKLLPRSNYCGEVEAINQRTGYQPRLLLSLHTQRLDSAQLQLIIRDIDLIAQDEQTSDWHLRMGVNRLHLRDVEQAIKHLNEAVDHSPQQPITYLVLSNARLMLAATTTDGKEVAILRGLALKELDLAIQHAPKMGYLYYNRAIVHDLLGHQAAAVEDYTTAIALLPNPAEAYFNRGLIYEQQEKKELAIADLSRAGELGIYRAYSNIHRIQSR